MGTLQEVGSMVSRAVRLTIGSLPRLALVLLVGLGVLSLSVPAVWVWSGAAVELVGVDDAEQMSSSQAMTLVALIGLPVTLWTSFVALSVVTAAFGVMDGAASDRRTRPLRTLGRGMRVVPRLVAGAVVGTVVLAGLIALAPVAVLAGIFAGLSRWVLPQVRPAVRTPSRAAVVMLMVPFGAAIWWVVRWAHAVPQIVLRREGVRAALRSTRAAARERGATLVLALGAVASSGLGLLWGARAAARSFDLAAMPWTLTKTAIQVLVALVAMALLVTAFRDGGGRALPLPEPRPRRPRALAVTSIFALFAVLIPLGGSQTVDLAGATSPAPTIVVNDLGDADDADPFDSVCETSPGSGVCTLRAAISQANESDDQVIGFAVGGRITVSSTLAIRRTMTIDASGAPAPVTIDGGGATRVFFVAVEVLGGGGATISDLTITGGFEATGGSALFAAGAAQGVVLERVTVAGNDVGSGATSGAVFSSAPMTIANSTFSGNSGGAGATTPGGDVMNGASGTLAISQSTFVGAGGGSAIDSLGGSVVITNSLVVHQFFACGTGASGSGNVTTDDPAICPGTVTTVADAGVAPLAAQGGATETIRLLPGSPAIDAGTAASCAAIDQRGVARPLGATCDAGAYEFDPATTTSISAGPDPTAYGATVTLDATVSAVSEPGTPTGSVEFFAGTTSLGSAPLGPSGVATLDVDSLETGTHDLTAEYLGDASYASSTSTPEQQTVMKATVTVSLTSSINPSGVGDPVTFTATVTNANGAVPGGTVTFFDGTTAMSSAETLVAGEAQHTTASLAGGPHTISAAYSGDGNHVANSSNSVSQDVVAGTTVAVVTPATATTFGEPAAFGITVTPDGSGVTPTGTVTLEHSGTIFGPELLDETGNATITSDSLPPGTNEVVAHYSGDSFNSAASSPAATTFHDVVAAGTTTSLTVQPPGTSGFGEELVLTATVTSPDSAATPTGSVTFMNGEANLIGVALDASGVATWRTSTLPTGHYDFKAVHNPGSGFTTSSSDVVAHDIDALATVTTVTASAGSSTFGEPVTFSATVTAPGSSLVPAGSVTFRDGNQVVGVGVLDGVGQAQVTGPAAGAGSRSITAEFNGSGDFAGSTSDALVHTVHAAAVDVQVDTSPSPSVFGSTVRVDISVQATPPGAGIPTGDVTLSDGAATVAVLPLDGSGMASIDLDDLPVGSHEFSATYAGDSNFLGGDGTRVHTVAEDTATVTLHSSPNPSLFTTPVTLTATISGTEGAIPTGTVQFLAGATPLGDATLDGNGVATLSTSDLPPGQTLLRAVYGGDGGFDGGSDDRLHTVDPSSTTTGLTIDTGSGDVHSLVQLRATVDGVGTAATPTGTVAFHLADGTKLGDAPLDASGVAVLERLFPLGFHTVEARFPTTAGWRSSTSTQSSFGIGKAGPNVTLAGAPDPVVVGGDVTWTATVTVPAVGPQVTGTVDFFSGTTLLGTADLTAGGQLTVPAPDVPGTWSVLARYNGDANHSVVTSSTADVAVIGHPTTLTVLTSPASSYVGSDVNVRAFVDGSPLTVPVAGTVRFTSDAPGFGTRVAPIGAGDLAEITVSGLTAGTWTFSAEYLPAAGAPFSGSSGDASQQVVKRPASVVITDVTDPAFVGAPVTVSVSTTDLSGGQVNPTGTVTIEDGDGNSCTTTVAAGSCTLVFSSPGLVELVATYGGDGRMEPDTSSAHLLQVRLATPAITVRTLTPTWVTGDRVVISWDVVGPATGTVTVRDPFGAGCVSTELSFGTCELVFPYGLRGQSIPVDVSYSGNSAFEPISATVTETVLGCHRVSFEVVPAEAGTMFSPPGNCNGGAGFVDGTSVTAAAIADAPYFLDFWLEDGSSGPAFTFTVSETARSATAVLNVRCVALTTSVDSRLFETGGVRYGGFVVAAPAPNCPGRPSVPQLDALTGVTTSWYVQGTSVTLTATPFQQSLAEFKGWEGDRFGGFLSTQDPTTTLTLDRDVDVKAWFGVQCVRPTFLFDGPGTLSVFSPSKCIDADGFAFAKDSEVGVTLTPDRYAFISGFNKQPDRRIDKPIRYPDTFVDLVGANVFWNVTGDDVHVVSFDVCRELTSDVQGEGTVNVLTKPNCPTRLEVFGDWYLPDTRVQLLAVPRPPYQSVQRIANQNREVTIYTSFLRWDAVDSTSSLEPERAFVRMTQDRTVRPVFYDQGNCQPLVLKDAPVGASASLDFTTLDRVVDDCPDGELELLGQRRVRFDATAARGTPRVGWVVHTTQGRFDDAVRLGLENGGDALVRNWTTAQAYFCTVVQPEITLIAPDGTSVTGPPPPDSRFIRADKSFDCPLWDNAFKVNQQVKVAALAPPLGYRFLRWEGDVSGTADEIELPLSEGHNTLKVRAVYEVICNRLTLLPGRAHKELSPTSNCPGEHPADEPPLAGNQIRYIGGTAVLLDAKAKEDHDFNGWSGDGLLGRGALITAFDEAGLSSMSALIGAMDAPAMVTVDIDNVRVTAHYTEHTWYEELGDDLAVFGKKTIGVIATAVQGSFEALGMGLTRLTLLAVSEIAEASGASDGVMDTLDTAMQSLDLVTMGLSCAAEWAQGNSPPNPATVDVLSTAVQSQVSDATGSELAGQAVKATITNLGGKSVPGGFKGLSEAMWDYRLARQGIRGNEAFALKVPIVNKQVLGGKTFTKLKVFKAGLGSAAAVGFAIYDFVAGGPGVKWEDTAEEAWETGAGPYLSCVQREMSEALKGVVPPPN